VAGVLSELGPEELAQLQAGLKAMALRALRDADAAEEAAQETLARTVAALRDGRFREGESLGAFVRGIARHVIADVFRARERVRRLDAPQMVQDQSPPPDALSALITEQERERVRAALEQLPAADHEILQLSYFEGLTSAEIALRLGEPADRVRKRKSRALNRLRHAFLGRTPSGHESA